MKIPAPIAFVLFASCAINDTPATSSATSASTCTPLGADVTQSENWTAAQKRTYEDVWPTGHCIVSTQVLIRNANRYDVTTGLYDIPAFMAAVVWKDSSGNQQLGHVYWVTEGTDGSDFHTTLDNTIGTRCNTAPNRMGGGTGTPGGGVGPTPGPQVDQFVVGSNFAWQAKQAALALDNATGPTSPFVGADVAR